jgi:hypothetical protein
MKLLFDQNISFNNINESPTFDKNLILLFPNPSTNNLTIQTPQKSSIQILNIQSQILKSIQS